MGWDIGFMVLMSWYHLKAFNSERININNEGWDLQDSYHNMGGVNEPDTEQAQQ